MADFLCNLDDVAEGQARGFALDDSEYIVLRDNGALYVYRNRCPHLGLPLEWDQDSFLDNDGSYLRCANHGALFLKDSGECIQGPCRGDALPAVPFTRDGDRIFV